MIEITKKRELTPKQEKFSQMYVELGNQYQAYKNAYKTDNMKDGSIRAKASELFNNPLVSSRINELRKELSTRNSATLDKVVRGIADIATFDIAELYDKDGNFKNIHDIPKYIRSAITGIKVFEEFEGQGRDRVCTGMVKEVKIINKLDAFEKLMKHLGGYELDNNQNSNKVMIIQLPDNGRK